MSAARHLEHDRAEPDVVDMVAELVDAHRHRVHVLRDPDAHGTTVATWHRVRVPSLIDQLDDAAPGGDQAPKSGGYASKPAARVDSIDALHTMDRGVTRWLNRYDVDQAHLDLGECVRRLGALMADRTRFDRCQRRTPAIDRASDAVTCCTWHDAARDVRRWWARARIVTGWDEPAWRPDVTCPVCGTRGSLGVRLRERVATCMECHEGWDATSYQQLAEHVRTESLARARAGRPMPCGRLDESPEVDMRVLCPACGSARCQRAVASRSTPAA